MFVELKPASLILTQKMSRQKLLNATTHTAVVSEYPESFLYRRSNEKPRLACASRGFYYKPTSIVIPAPSFHAWHARDVWQEQQLAQQLVHSDGLPVLLSK